MRYYLLSIISAGLLILSFPRFDLHYLVWFALVPFFFAVSGTCGWKRFLCSYIFWAFFLGGLLWWITVVRYPASLGYLVGTLLFPLLFSFLGVAMGYFLRRDSPFEFLLVPAALWVGLEYLFSLGPLGFPWWVLGYTQSWNLPIAQAASFGGVYAVSFLIVLVNGIIYALCSGRGRHHQVVLGGVVVALGLILLAGFWMMSGEVRGDARIKVAVVQGGFSQDEKEDPKTFPEIFFAHMQDTRKAVEKFAPDMVIWSETTSNSEWLISDAELPLILNLLRRFGIHLVAGAYHKESGKEYNSVLVLSPEDGYQGRYDKMHLVPFGEYMPLRSQIKKISALSKWVDKNVYEGDTTPGKHYKVFKTKWGRFSVVICFESVFAQISREMVRRGAELLMVLTNDAWFKKTHAADQHAAMAVFRAIENRRYVIQGASSGVSVIVDPYGRRVRTSGLFT
ncbi:MAG: apolipoprotein N-acyltransferase, partial [bacterium]